MLVGGSAVVVVVVVGFADVKGFHRALLRKTSRVGALKVGQ